MELLQPAPRTERYLACAHGVQFYDVVGGGARSERTAWSYRAPQTSMKQIDHWIGVWEDVQVE